MDVGGKLLTNHLKEVSSFFMFNLFFFTQVISYRQLHVLDETYVMNGCKEDCCYVAKDFDCEVGKLENSKANLIAYSGILAGINLILDNETY